MLKNDNFRQNNTFQPTWHNFHEQENKKYLTNRHSYSKYTQYRQNNNWKTKQIPRTGEQNMWYVEGHSTSGPDSNFSYGNNSKVTVTKSKET
jgi:hypothetical protein